MKKIITLLFCVAVFTLAVLFLNAIAVTEATAALIQPSGATNVTYGLVGWWPLDETSGITLGDLSGYGNSANLVGSPLSVSGEVTNGYQFNGSSQYATINYSYSYDVTNFTLMCWVNTTANGGEILSRNPYTAWEFCVNEGRTDNGVAPGQPSFFNGTSWATAGTAINTGTWQHVAVVVGSGTTSFYVNGQLTSSSPQAAPPTSASVGIYMAQRAGGGVNLAGSLDDVRIYNRTLSAGEIANQYQWRTGTGTLFPTNGPPTTPSSARTYYIDYSTGSDQNNGLSMNTPWQNHPFMANWAGTYKHSAGDQFIFRGGITWPASCFPLIASLGGTSATSDYYGTISSWYAGPSWSKPIWDDNGNPLDTMSTSGDALVLITGSYLTLDSFIITNLNWTTGASVYGVNMGSGVNIVITNCEFRNFIVTGSGEDTLQCIRGYSGGSVGTKVSHCIFTGQPASTGVGVATYYADTWEYNTVSFMPNAFIGLCTTNQFNIIHDIGHSITVSVHENAIEMFPPLGRASYTRGNIITNCSAGMLIFDGQEGRSPGQNFTNYIYNNLVANNTAQTPGITLDTDTGSNGMYGVFYVLNNTLQDSEAAPMGFIRVTFRSTNSYIQAVYAENNHFIDDSTNGVVPDRGVLAAITQNNNLVMANSMATSYGYTMANSWKPASAACPTVGIGTNAPATVFSDDLLRNGRPLPAWDIGAYQYHTAGVGPVAWDAGLHVISSP